MTREVASKRRVVVRQQLRHACVEEGEERLEGGRSGLERVDGFGGLGVEEE